MTICAAMLTKDACWIGSDTLWVRGDGLKGTNAQKVRRSPQGLVYAISGSPAVIDLVAEVIGDTKSLSMSKFKTNLRKAFIAEGWEGEKGEGYCRPTWNSAVLVTDGRALYELDTAMILESHPIGEFVAIGFGVQIAFGAAHASREYCAIDVVKAAIEASIECSSGCGGNVDLLKVLPAQAILIP